MDGLLTIRAMSTNTGKMYIGLHSDGTVSSTTGYELNAGEYVTLAYVGDLNNIMVDSSVNLEKVCWLRLE